MINDLVREINYSLDEYDLTEYRLPELSKPTDNRTNLEAWREAMDWTTLRRLEIKSPSLHVFNNLKDSLPDLKSIRAGPLSIYGHNETENQAIRDALTAFILDAPHLEEIGIGPMGQPLPVEKFVEVHGNTLKALEVHEYATYNSVPRPVFNTTQLAQIRDQCPHLEKLELDVNRNGTWVSHIESLYALHH